MIGLRSGSNHLTKHINTHNHHYMKQIITLASLFSVASLLAQPTIQYADVSTGVTTLSVYTLTDPGTASEPGPGANQTWDLGSVQLAMTGTATLGTSTGTPYAATYPSANWTWVISPSGGSVDYMYLVLSTSGMENVATHVPAAPNVYTDYQKIMQFPLAFGNAFTDAYASPGHTGTDTWTYDGHGTLITPIGTFADQLKLTSSDDDVVIWNASPLYPRIIANSDGIMLFGPSTVGVSEAEASPLTVFPVPANTSLNVMGISGTARWSIMDLQGRAILGGGSFKGPQATVDITALAQG